MCFPGGPMARNIPRSRDKALSSNVNRPFSITAKIREAFNPNDLGDAYYLTLEYKDK